MIHAVGGAVSDSLTLPAVAAAAAIATVVAAGYAAYRCFRPKLAVVFASNAAQGVRDVTGEHNV